MSNLKKKYSLDHLVSNESDYQMGFKDGVKLIREMILKLSNRWESKQSYIIKIMIEIDKL